METKRNRVSMEQPEYYAFREQMKRWMLDNSDIYDEFEELMNSQSDMGVQQIMECLTLSGE